MLARPRYAQAKGRSAHGDPRLIRIGAANRQPSDRRPAGIEEDLGRRDFTVNALAVALVGPEAGFVRCAPLGIEDLESRRLRVLHERSFLDDPTRLVRLVRYASRLEFEVEPETRRLADEAIRSGALAT